LDEIVGPGWLPRSDEALGQRTMEAELTNHLGYEPRQ
jgi:hypothetical protein